MKKEFTQEDILKKHETNIKTASTAILFSGILGLIYVVRYILSGNFNFYFSLSFTDMILRLSENKGSVIIPAVISLIYVLAYTSLAVFPNKKTKLFWAALAIYLFDFLCLAVSMLFLFQKPLDPACFIDVIVHLFVIVFLVVGIVSSKAMSKSEKK